MLAPLIIVATTNVGSASLSPSSSISASPSPSTGATSKVMVRMAGH